MCVGMSAKVIKVDKNTALIDANGARLNVSSRLIDDLMPGDYVMVHAGAAISRITDDDESETLELLEELL